MPDDADLAALLGSRICHDLISPIGAIGNGVELLQLESGQTSPEMTLIAQSVTHASARIRFFRVAFGGASVGQRMARNEACAILSDMQHGGRLVFDWQGPVDLSRQTAKLAFLMILCLETAMPYGGQVVFTATADGVRLTGLSPKVRIDEGLWELLADGKSPPDITAAQVHFALLANELTRQGRKAGISLPPGEVIFDF